MKRFPATIFFAIALFMAYCGIFQISGLRRDHVRAIAAWRKNPTPATGAELDRQKRISTLYNLGYSAVVFGVMVGATLMGVLILRKGQSADETRLP